MKQWNRRRMVPSLIILGIAIAIGFFSGLWIASGKDNKGDASSPSGGGAAAVQSKDNNQGGTFIPDLGGKINVSDSYSVERPSLMGLTLLDTTKEVTDRYGKPFNRYAMEDKNDPINVYDYSQFTVGFGKNDLVRFIEIHGNAADPGLQGIRLGGTQSSAIKILGVPDTNTGYVMTYLTAQTTLKFDIDPETGTIQSIKLFERVDT